MNQVGLDRVPTHIAPASTASVASVRRAFASKPMSGCRPIRRMRASVDQSVTCGGRTSMNSAAYSKKVAPDMALTCSTGGVVMSIVGSTAIETVTGAAPPATAHGS